MVSKLTRDFDIKSASVITLNATFMLKQIAVGKVTKGSTVS